MSDNLIHFVILATGQELVGEQVEQLIDNTDTITVKRIRMIAYQQNHDGTIGVGPAPFVMVNPDGEYSFPKNMIAICDNVPDGVEKMYLQSVTGVAIAGAGDVPKSPIDLGK